MEKETQSLSYVHEIPFPSAPPYNTFNSNSRDTSVFQNEKEFESSFAAPFSNALSSITPSSNDALTSSTNSFSIPATMTLKGIRFSPHPRTLAISSRGTRLFRLPLPPRQPTIPITASHLCSFNCINGELEMEGEAEEIYTSLRPNTCSGNSVLLNTRTCERLIETKYKFGFGADCFLKLLDSKVNGNSEEAEMEEIRILGRWRSRSIRFEISRRPGEVFEWRYLNKKERKEIGLDRGTNVLVLSVMDKDRLCRGEEILADAKHRPSTRVFGERGESVLAMLIRTKQTRTPGSSKTTAGNGGQLVFDIHSRVYLQQSLIVATCLVMLKREIDRQRTLQFVVLTAIASAHP